MTLFDPLTLPNRQSIPNRFAKASMEENMATGDRNPSSSLITLYQQWAKGDLGLILSGNVMIAADAMTGPGGVVLDENSDLSLFEQWAKAGKQNGGQFWMQINHPGRQMPTDINAEGLAPSAIAMDLTGCIENTPISSY